MGATPVIPGLLAFLRELKRWAIALRDRLKKWDESLPELSRALSDSEREYPVRAIWDDLDPANTGFFDVEGNIGGTLFDDRIEKP